MFYECPKCKRRWEYPLGDCPFCFVPLKKMEATAAKVNSVVKVSIPTLFHPNVPYFILLLEDELGNLWGYKSEKEYKAGDEFKIGQETSTDLVAIWRVKYDVRDAIEKVIELAGGIGVGQDSKVVVMPTIAMPSHSYFKDNTSPQFLEAVLQILIDRGVKPENISVASQSFDEQPISVAAQKSGLLSTCGKFNIMPMDLGAGEFERVSTFDFSKTVLKADLTINLAMEKIGQAAATQNMFKVLKKENYLGAKYLSSEREVAETLESLLGKMLVIGEAEYVQRSNKLTTFLGLVMASKSPRRLDRVFNEVTQAFSLPMVLEDVRVENIPVTGRSIKEVQYRAEIF